MPATAVDSFLAKINHNRGMLHPLNEAGFKALVARKHPQHGEWMSILKKVVKCKADGPTGRREQKKSATFDDANCTLKLKAVSPRTQCLHVSQNKGSVELASRSLVVNFLKLYHVATRTLTYAGHHHEVFWG